MTFAQLNEYQKEAVVDESLACLVNANVGSGKTTVLIAKILYLHDKKSVPFSKMVILTFTNKAADEIRDRLHELEPEAKIPFLGTFHGVCYNMLKEMLPEEGEGYRADFSILLPEEELEMALMLMTEHQLKIKYKNRLKKRLEKALAVKKEEDRISKYGDDIFILTRLLMEQKMKENKMSYQDLIDQTIIVLKAQNSFKPDWIIIDEVQDSDSSQLNLIHTLMGDKTHLFAVGDPNQVIYSWRGSAFQVFYGLRERYQARELSLPINYRSSSSILEVARHFLQFGDKIKGVNGIGNKIHIKNHYNPFQEADYLAGRIRELHEQGLPYREIAVFYRLQSQSKVLEDVFLKEGIPYEVSQKRSIQDIPVLNWLLHVLRFSLNPKDETARKAALENREYGFGGRKTEKEKEEFLNKMTCMSENYGVIQKIPDLYTYFELDNRLHPTSASFKEDKENVQRFLILLQEMAAQETVTVTLLKDLLNRSSLYGISAFHSEIHEETDAVRLMTLHASKGLEFSDVFIIGVNYGLIPLMSGNMDGEEEERRLFFVGITRARNNLELSYYTSPDHYRVSPGPSRYLKMIPDSLVEDSALQKPVTMDVNLRLLEIKKQILASRAEAPYLCKDTADKNDIEMKEREDSKLTEQNKDFYLEEKSVNKIMEKRVRHAKYGTGIVVREDEINITVCFDDYGEKEFIRALCALEELP